MPPPTPPHITTRQRQIIALVAAGHSNPAIAAELGITAHTVKALLYRMYRRLGARDRAHLAAIAITHHDLDTTGVATTRKATA